MTFDNSKEKVNIKTSLLLIALMTVSTQHVFADNSSQVAKEDYLFASEAGKYFSLALNVMRSPLGKVADESAVAY